MDRVVLEHVNHIVEILAVIVDRHYCAATSVLGEARSEHQAAYTAESVDSKAYF
jgi:hypothetical protein